MIFDVYIYNKDSDGNTVEKLLYYPNDETYVITNSKLELALNEAGSFEFDIPSYNLCYEDFEPRSTMISVRQNDVEVFYGEVREITENFDFTKHIYAVGELAFLFDSIQPQKKYQGTPYEMLKSMLSYHNSQVESRKKFNIGYVNVSDDYVYHFTNREDTLTAIRDKLCDTLNVYLRIRKTNGQKYLDLVPLENYGTYCMQEIQFGENLLDYAKNISASDIATCCIPLGKRLEDKERTKAAVEGLDEYLTIVGTTIDQYHKAKENDYVQIDSAIAQFGYVRVVKSWDDVTDAENLRKKATEWLKSAQYETMTLELNALDLNLLDSNFDSFDVGDTIHAWALPFGMDTTFPVQKKTIYLNELSNNTVVLGQSMPQSYTKQNSKAFERLIEELPDISPILQQAKDNALAMLLAETTGGHVVYEYDKTNSYIEAINVINATELKNATQRWVWNLNGFGYMSRKTTADNWSTLKAAITMDGRIVADFVTTGTMSADRIRGGDLELGGTGYGKDGSIHVKNANGTTLVTLDKNGLTLSGGQTISYNNISNKPKIPTQAEIETTSTKITENYVASHTFYGNSYYATKDPSTGKYKSWFAPDGAIDSDFSNQTVKFKVDGDNPFRIDTSGRAYATRFISGEKGVGANTNWGTEKNWSAMIGGSIYTHSTEGGVAYSKNDYFGLNLAKLYEWCGAINIYLDQFLDNIPNPVFKYDARKFNG